MPSISGLKQEEVWAATGTSSTIRIGSSRDASNGRDASNRKYIRKSRDASNSRDASSRMVMIAAKTIP
jgi:hypothetical protein